MQKLSQDKMDISGFEKWSDEVGEKLLAEIVKNSSGTDL